MLTKFNIFNFLSYYHYFLQQQNQDATVIYMIKGFDTEKYLRSQMRVLKEVVEGTSNENLTIEFGGKIIQDKHAARVLPGYDEDAKLKLVKLFSDADASPILAVSGKDINDGRIRGDFKTRYDEETLRLLDSLSKRGLSVQHIALTRIPYNEGLSDRLSKFVDSLDNRGIQTSVFYEIEPYNTTTDLVEQFKRNKYIDTGKKINMIISPGGGSGKFNVCLSQLTHEMLNNKVPHYVKLETFPIFNVGVMHPIHLAFMAASADFFDHVKKDKKHGDNATSYNRDLENYELLNSLAKTFEKNGKHLASITSATSMGLNRVKDGIIDDELIQKEACAEVARRLKRYQFEHAEGITKQKVVDRAREILHMI